MNTNHDEEWLDQFKAEMKKLEDGHEPVIPSQSQLLTTIHMYKAKQKKAFKRELVTFFITALCILSSYILIALKLPPIFLWIQVLTIGCIPVLFFVERKRRKNEVIGNG